MKKYLFLLLVIGLIVSPVMAETENINYESYISVNGVIGSDKPTSNGQIFNINFLRTTDITRIGALKFITTGLTPTSATAYRDSYSGGKVNTYSKDSDMTLKIGSNVVGNGQYSWTHNYVDGIPSGYVLAIVIDDLDVGPYSGAQTITMVLDDPSVIISYCKIGSSFTITPTGSPSIELTGYTGTAHIGKSISTAYYVCDIHQILNYDIDKEGINIAYIKDDINNRVTIKNADSEILYDTQAAENFDKYFPFEKCLSIEVHNPYLSSDLNPYWVFNIPETSTQNPPEQTAMVNAYVYDSVTGNLINGHNTSTLYYGDSLPQTCTWPGGVSHTTLDWSYAQSAQVNYSAQGYEPSLTYNWTGSIVDTWGYYLEVGVERDLSVYLMPTGAPTNTTFFLTFEIVQAVDPGATYFFRSSDAAITCDGGQRLTGPTGITWFNVTPGTYSYTVTKNGFESVQGSVSVSGNTKESVSLYQTQTEPTPTDDPTGGETGGGEDSIHQGVEEAYGQFGEIIPGGVMLICLLFLMKVLKKS